MKKRVFIVTGHCDNLDKEYMTLLLLEKIRNKFPNDDIVYSSHLLIPEKIQKYVDYSFFIKENPIENRDIITDLTQSYAEFLFDIPDKGSLIKLSIPNHGYAHHLLISGSMRCLNHDYEFYHFSNYDIDFNFLMNDFHKREMMTTSMDGFFYEFKINNDWVNTEIFTVNKKISQYISNLKNYDSYTGFISLEEKYTDFLKNKFNIYIEKNIHEDVSFGSVDFKFSRSESLRYLIPNLPEFSIIPIIKDNAIKITILHKKNNNLKFIFHYFEGAREVIIQGNQGSWNIIDVDHPCLVDLISNDFHILRFDLKEKTNFGEILR